MITLDSSAAVAPAALRCAPPGQGPGQPIKVDGVVLGAALKHELGVRFVAADARVTEMDQSIWPDAGYAHRSARQMFRAGRKNRSAARH